MLTILKKCHVNPSVAHHVTEGLILTSLRGVDSHGIRLFPHYIKGVKSGRINPKPNMKFKKTAPGTGKLNADHTFGHAAGAEAMKKAILLARASGIGAVSVYNSSHFGAAFYYAQMAAAVNMIGLSFTHADSLLLSYGSKRPYFGTNPICFVAPCAGEPPFCLDTSTSVVSWNKILQYRQTNKRLPKGFGANKNGKEILNPKLVTSVFPIGGYKGFGLAMMVDILCGILSSMPFGHDITSMYVHPIHKRRFLGHFLMAIDIARFQKVSTFKRRLKTMMTQVRREPKTNRKQSVLVAGDPEKMNYKVRIKKGIPVDEDLMANFHSIADEHKVITRF